MSEDKLTYRDAGVDTREGERAVKLMKEHVKKTFDAGVMGGLGGFGSLYLPDLTDVGEPVLVAGTDGVGTKLMVAFMADRHDTVGRDCVGMCVNDVLCQGAKPLFFLDYIAAGKVKAEKIADIVKGVADGCIEGGCALVGGETAEMPGLYAEDEYDLAGFCVGLVDRDRIIDGSGISEGDVIIGLASSGLHSNGYSLARKVVFEKAGLGIDDEFPGLGVSVADALLEPTRIYARQVHKILSRTQPKGLVHITGGGYYENIPRIFPAGLGARIETSSWQKPALFEAIAELGGIAEKEMYSTFNMGIGLMAIVDRKAVDTVMGGLESIGEKAFVIGEAALGTGVTLW
ncbi:MAG: phosphoribosylformylglycinamidine cyclo-ligase [Clostridiales Family XIII bacterium]|nr:phosphoribosylformylglycinamidine cyclo-ligase [Clostridiales Family XIII bacterium]